MLPKPTLYVCGDESGGFSLPCFVLGIVTATHPEHHSARLADWRRQFRYHREIAYATTDGSKRRTCERWLDHFAQDDDLEFSGLLIPSDQYDLRRYRTSPSGSTGTHTRSDRPAAVTSYNYRCKQLLASTLSARYTAAVSFDGRTRARGDNLPAYIVATVRVVSRFDFVDSATVPLVQLADLLTGSIFGDYTATTHPVKRGLIEHLKQCLALPRLIERRLGLARKFAVTVWQAPSARAFGHETVPNTRRPSVSHLPPSDSD